MKMASIIEVETSGSFTKADHGLIAGNIALITRTALKVSTVLIGFIKTLFLFYVGYLQYLYSRTVDKIGVEFILFAITIVFKIGLYINLCQTFVA